MDGDEAEGGGKGQRWKGVNGFLRGDKFIVI